MNNQLLIIIDDEASVRDSLSLLFSQVGFLVATFQSVEELISSAYYGVRCSAIIDMNLGGLSGIDALKMIKKEQLPINVIVISAYGTPKSVREAFKVDAFDFVEKPYDPNELIDIVRRACRQLPVQMATETVLTKREKEVRALLLKGLHAKEIANILGISARTVETHKGRIYEKLNVRSALELVANSEKSA